jgi:hypothetical protein
MLLENVPSVMKLGILSNERATKVEHYSVALEVVQERRDLKHVPGGLKLHQYANLYFHARNPMMYKRKDLAGKFCVLRVSTEVRHIEGVVFTDRNASSDYVRFLHPSQESVLDYDSIFAMDWRHPNEFEFYARKSKKCAEVLVPHCVRPEFLTGAYTVDQAAEKNLESQGFDLPITINPEMFFR